MRPFASIADEYAALIDALRPLLTPTFLTTLVHANRVGGFADIDDIYEVDMFVEWCHTVAGQPCPELYNCNTSAFEQEPPLPVPPACPEAFP